MISLIIAGGIALAAPSNQFSWPDIDNHTLKGEKIPSSKVVTRNVWGTPMLPDGTGGYSLIAPINEDYIAQSLIIPPWNIPANVTTEMVIYRPLPESERPVETVAPIPAPVPVIPVVPAPEPVSAQPVEELPPTEAAPVEPAPAQ
jgi:hypothetical protein